MTVSKSKLDIPEILSCLFHPRKDMDVQTDSGNMHVIEIPVEKDIRVGAKFHHFDKKAPVILFFHGNGEIVSDYDDISVFFNQTGLNFFPVDYRGYGISNGTPSVSSMLHDAHTVFSFVKSWLKQNDYSGDLIIMGRSLGSAPALEIASHYQNEISALIIESGFAFLLPLLKIIGVFSLDPDITEDDGTSNHIKIKGIRIPLLVIHAEFDHIIPFSDGRYLYDNAPSSEKAILEIKNADHNSVLLHGYNDYFKAIKNLFTRL
jgi:hypothetical protein